MASTFYGEPIKIIEAGWTINRARQPSWTPPMGAPEDAFGRCLERLMTAEGWQPTIRTASARRQYFGPDRAREWIQSDFYAALDGVPGKPTVIGEFDTAASELEHNIGKYLWWVSDHPPFWCSPALIVSAFAEPLPANYLLHENIAIHLGRLLEARVPGTYHILVGVRGEPKTHDVGVRLANRAFGEIKNRLPLLARA
jgi:hypothetical protein